MSKEPLPTDFQTEEILWATILKAASRHIPSGRHRLNQPRRLPSEITNKKERDDLRRQDPTSPVLQRMNDEINTATVKHKQETCCQTLNSLDV